LFSRWQSTAATAAATELQEGKVAVKEENKPFIPTPERKYEFFQNVEFSPGGVAVVRFDCPKSVNSISFKLADEAKVLWKEEIENNKDVKAVVFSSAKPNMFVAGADIFDLKNVENKQDLIKICEDGVNFFKHMSNKGVPLVCAIDGPALGGGLEWALWCDYRVCSDSPKVKLGLPEVKLGLLPGFGGTQNLHKLVGLQDAMDMMLTGKDVRPDKAKKNGTRRSGGCTSFGREGGHSKCFGLGEWQIEAKAQTQELDESHFRRYFIGTENYLESS
jgi:hypothetical protein